MAGGTVGVGAPGLGNVELGVVGRGVVADGPSLFAEAIGGDIATPVAVALSVCPVAGAHDDRSATPNIVAISVAVTERVRVTGC